MNKTYKLAFILSVLVGWSLSANADYIRVRFGSFSILFEGRAGKGLFKKITHPKFREVQPTLPYNKYDEPIYVEKIYEVESLKRQLNKRAGKATTVELKMKEARWAVKHGMIDEAIVLIDEILAQDASHKLASEVKAFYDKLAIPLEDASKEKEYVTKTLGRTMSFKTSEHYLLAYDTDDKRADERLLLLEKVYDTFFTFFALKGRVLEKPEDFLIVILFKDHEDYLAFSKQLSPELESAAGYWSPNRNIAVFFDQGTHPMWKALNDMAKGLKVENEKARKLDRAGVKVDRANLVRLTATVELLRLIQQENEDVEVVSHEATHQLAGNSGLFPRDIRIPRWVHEGLASYFESPQNATWSGIGAVNKTRLSYYRALKTDREHSNIDFIVSDDIYTLAKGHGSVLHAYGQAWALTHFLMDKHFDELNKFWRILGRMPADTIFSEITVKRCFDEAFGASRKEIDIEWRTHMNSLKTDTEVLLGEDADEVVN